MDISQIRGTIHFICAFFDLFLLSILWFKGKSKATFHYGWTVLFLAFNAFAYGGLYFFKHNELFWNRAAWIGMLIMPAYITFLYVFTGRTKYFRLKSFTWYSAGAILTFIAFFTPLLTTDVDPEYPHKFTAGPLEPVGRLFVIVGLVVSFVYLFKEYFKSTGFRKLQIKYFILALTIHSSGGIIFGGILPLFLGPEFLYGDVLTFFAIPGISLTTYAIFKKRLFAIRVILTEILVGAIGLILLIQALLAETIAAKTLGFITFFAFLLVGYLLVKVTQKEIQRKEEAEGLALKLKQLNETLEDKVKERTQELEQSYQEIKKRKDELEKFYKLTVGRELKMVELKKKIEELKKKIEE